MEPQKTDFKVQKDCANVSKISSSVLLQYYFHMNFKICFQYLLLAANNFFSEDILNIHREVCNTM